MVGQVSNKKLEKKRLSTDISALAVLGAIFTENPLSFFKKGFQSLPVAKRLATEF